MKTYKIKVHYIFEGLYFVQADNKEEAKRIVKEDCGMCMGDIQTTNDEAVKNWDFDMSPVKIVIS